MDIVFRIEEDFYGKNKSLCLWGMEEQIWKSESEQKAKYGRYWKYVSLKESSNM
jgi:hypothetical protein